MRDLRSTLRSTMAPLLLLAALGASSLARAELAVGVSVQIAPPLLPVYVQPPIPQPGYIWTPGYWAYGPYGYYWVPGTWVLPPTVGVLWTPGYWGWSGGFYAWHGGYWGPHVGFYGGVNYGYGYVGTGYAGGRWENGAFRYNTAVNNVRNVSITNSYTSVVNAPPTRVSYNGGAGGLNRQPSRQEQAAADESHLPASPMQQQHEHAASADRSLLASANHGHPPIAATSRPGEFKGPGVVAARLPVPAPGRPVSASPPGPARPVSAGQPAPRPEGRPPAQNRPAPARESQEHRGGGPERRE
jgi:hypothetical protein